MRVGSKRRRRGRDAADARGRYRHDHGDRTPRLSVPVDHGIFRDCLRAGYPAWSCIRPATRWVMASSASPPTRRISSTVHRPGAAGRRPRPSPAACLVEIGARSRRAARVLEVRPSNPIAIALYSTKASTKSAAVRAITRPNGARGCDRDGDRVAARRLSSAFRRSGLAASFMPQSRQSSNQELAAKADPTKSGVIGVRSTARG